jgi:hypothetical protein
MKKSILIAISIFCFHIVNAQMMLTNETIFSGFVGKYEIRMKLAVPYGGATSCLTLGEYYYTSNKGKIDLCESDGGRIVESVKGKESGYFVLNGEWNKNIGQTISGTWYSMLNNKSFPVVLKVITKGKN